MDRKNQLEVTVLELQDRMKTGLAKFEELLKTKEDLKNSVEFEKDVLVMKKVTMPFGEYATNCNECQITCHHPCGLKDGKLSCDVMDHSEPSETRSCFVCPGQCLWSKHTNDSYRWAYTMEKCTSKSIKEEWEAKKGRELMTYEVKEEVKAELWAKKEEIVDLIEYVLFFMQQLDKIAKHLEPNSEANFVAISDVMAKCFSAIVPFELKEKKIGYRLRVKILKKLRLRIFEINKDGRFTGSGILLYSEDERDLSSSDSSLYGDFPDSESEDPGEGGEEGEQVEEEWADYEEDDGEGADSSESE